MIVGSFHFKSEKTSIFDQHLNNIISSVEWTDSVLSKTSGSNYTFCSLRDKSLPKTKSEPWFINSDKEIAVLLDGQVYNVLELFGTNEDIPKHISNKYAELGDKLFNQLNGAFALVVIDLKANRVVLAKDHIGMVPISYTIKDGSLFFCSDTMGLAQALYAENKIDHEFIISSLYHFEENYAPTPHKSVHKVLPGHFAQFSTKIEEQVKYWNPENIQLQKRNYSQIVNDLRSILEQSIQKRSNKEYHIGSHISGGLDSSLITSIARKFNPKQESFYGFTWSPDHIESDQLIFDERKQIQKQAEKDGVKVVYSNFTEENYESHMKEWRAPSEWVFEENITRKANELKVNLIFSGWGGDEFLSMGAPHFNYELFWKGRWRKYLQQNSIKHPKRFLKIFLATVLFPRQTTAYLRYKTAPFMYKYIRKGAETNKLDELPRSVYTNKKGIHIGFINYKHLATRCEDWYIQGQRKGIEYRYPLLDKELIEYILSIPTMSFIEGDLDRNLIREMGKDYLIDDILKLEKKADPALGVQFKKILYKKNESYISEISQYRMNPYLDFFDFDALETDIDQQMKLNGKLSKHLTLVIPYVKMVHEFTQAYHNPK